MITCKQSKAARALLGWNKSRLAKEANADLNAVCRFEKGTSNPSAETIHAIENAFKKAEIEFSGTLGVAVKEDVTELITDSQCTQILWNKILKSFEGTKGGEILVTHVDETRGLSKHGEALIEYTEQLKKAHITQRLLSCEGDTNFLMPAHSYKWLPEAVFNTSRTCYIFNGCIALQCWESDTIIYVRNTKVYVAEKAHFEKLWLSAKAPQLPQMAAIN